MHQNDIYIERLIPAELDLTDPDQLDLLRHVERQYRFASMFVEGKRVLEIGCGVGFGASILLKEGRAASILAVDNDDVCIDIAERDYSAEGIEYRRCGYDEVTGHEQFDTVICINVLEHLRRPAAVLVHARNLLMPEGELIVSTYVTPTSDFNPTHLSDFSAGSFRRMLRKAGFAIEQELFRYKRFQPGRALSLMKNRKGASEERSGPRSLMIYYLGHPIKALRRAKSLLADGLTIINMLVRAIAV